tara:strand:- start:117 stop:476 length:360 start_codon:yes stop_codon:yes gene_type:complete
MTIKLAILRSGEDIIADMQEMVVGDDKRVVGYFLTRPCGVTLKNKLLDVNEDEKESYELKLFPWCPLTKDEVIPITTEWIVTIVEPIDKLKEMYEKEVLKNEPSKSFSSDKSTDSSKSD